MNPGRKPDSDLGKTPDSEPAPAGTGSESKSAGAGGFRQLSDLLSMGWNFALCIGVGLALGIFLDRWLGTRPWGTLIFLLLGIAAGFVNLIRVVMRLDGKNGVANSSRGTDDG